MNGSSIVIGLGKTGISCIRYLVEQGIPVMAMDTRENPPGLDEMRKNWPQIPIHIGSLDAALLLQAKELIVSPGLSLQEPAIASAIAQGIPAIGDIELFARAAKAPIVGITGSNAKGTVTTLVGDMGRKAGKKVLVGGNIGTPALDLLFEPTPDLYVLELSSFQLETTYSLKAAAATILNISPDHLDRYADLNAYIAAKQRIYNGCKAAVYNKDDKNTWPDSSVPAMLGFAGSTQPTTDFQLLEFSGDYWLAQGEQRLLPVNAMRIRGKHNWLNALAALALGTAVGLPMEPMLAALREFPGLPHRCQFVRERNDVAWYNDSKGTNIGSTLAAIEGLAETISGQLILIAGGLGKGADFTLLRDAVSQHVKQVILIGRDASIIAKALPESTTVDSLEAAVALADKMAQSGDAVLLSPACASFDMFKNFEHRGEVFTQLVRSLPE